MTDLFSNNDGAQSGASLPPRNGSAYPPVLDACCGSRMFWFDRKDSRALYIDKRRETHLAKDCSVKNGEREIVVNPDMVADFTNLPLFGHRTGKQAKTHWCAFIKQNEKGQR